MCAQRAKEWRHDVRVKEEVRCKCEHEQVRGVSAGQSASMGVRQGHKVRYVQWGVFCLSFSLSVCTGDISTKAMVGADIVAQVP